MTTIHAALEDSLFTVENVDDDPKSTRRLDGYRLQCVAADADGVFVGTFEEGIHRSVSSGFERVGEGVVGDRVMALAIDPTDPGTVWAGTEPSAVYRSTDGGNSWHNCEGLADLPSSSGWSFPPRPNTHHVRWIRTRPARPGALVRRHRGGCAGRDPRCRRDVARPRAERPARQPLPGDPL